MALITFKAAQVNDSLFLPCQLLMFKNNSKHKSLTNDPTYENQENQPIITHLPGQYHSSIFPFKCSIMLLIRLQKIQALNLTNKN